MVAAHSLSWIVFLPLGGALAIMWLPPERREAIKTVALCTAALPLIQVLVLVFRFDSAETVFQFVEHYTWAPALGFEYFVGVDGLSLPLVALVALVSFLALLTAWSVEERVKGFFALVLALETGLLGAFCALDTALLWVFWELVLVSMFFLVSLWGGDEGRRPHLERLQALAKDVGFQGSWVFTGSQPRQKTLEEIEELAQDSHAILLHHRMEPEMREEVQKLAEELDLPVREAAWLGVTGLEGEVLRTLGDCLEEV